MMYFTSVIIILLFLFLIWHRRFFSKSLTKKELDAVSFREEYDDMNAQEKQNFRRFMEEDDGKPFYMINLMKYREKALYPEGEFPGVKTGEDAAKLYNKAVIKELLKRGSYPVFYSRKIAQFLNAGEGTDFFTDIGIVRYRSRRDLLDIALSTAYQKCIKHKWASLEKTVVVPSKRAIMIDPGLAVPLFLAIVLLGVMVIAGM